MPELGVIDTMVLRKANAPLTTDPKERRAFAKRLALLQRIHPDDLNVLISSKLVTEYTQQVLEPRNDLVKASLEIMTDPTRHKLNWPRWPGGRQDKAAKCRFPPEDTHVLRTAFVDGEGSTIFSEEDRILRTDACIHRSFDVHVVDPTK